MEPEIKAEEILQCCLRHATLVATRMMPRDPEAESIANIACLRAMRSYDEDRGSPLLLFVGVCVRRHVWDYWRELRDRKEVQRTELWWERRYRKATPEPEPLPISAEDRQLLDDKYERRWPLDVIARRRGLGTRGRVRRLLKAAEDRLAQAAGLAP